MGIAALGGAAFYTGEEVITNTLQCQAPFEDWSWGEFGLATGISAVTGGVIKIPGVGSLLSKGMSRIGNSHLVRLVVNWHNKMQAKYSWGAPPGGYYEQGVGFRIRLSRGLINKPQELHHWLIPQRQWGKYVPNYIKNRSWNITVTPNQSAHGKIDIYRRV